MIRSAVTISLVEEARGGPFVYWHDLAGSCAKAKHLGFDAVELFAPGPDAVDRSTLQTVLDDNGLSLAAVGTGAGWVKHRWHLTLPDPAMRARARDFIRAMIDFGGALGAPAIIGSMQGRSGEGIDHGTAHGCLITALDDLGDHAAQHGVPLLFEPLNRYETNLVNTIEAGLALIRNTCPNIKLLADLFHMNIEEVDITDALRRGGPQIGHLHYVDSNRRPAGCGHIDYAPIVAALRGIDYGGYASAEALPYPDPDGAAARTMAAFKSHFA